MNESQVFVALRDTAALLSSQKLSYALIGGLAISVHGEPRATLDVDAVLNCDVQRALKLLEDITDSPFRPLFDGVKEVVRTGLLLPLEHKQTGIRIDLSIGMSSFDQQVIANASLFTLGGSEIFVASAEYLVVMKQLAGRPRDLDDIKGVLTRQGNKFDWEATLHIASELSQAVDDDLVTPLQAIRKKLQR